MNSANGVTACTAGIAHPWNNLIHGPPPPEKSKPQPGSDQSTSGEKKKTSDQEETLTITILSRSHLDQEASHLYNQEAPGQRLQASQQFNNS